MTAQTREEIEAEWHRAYAALTAIHKSKLVELEQRFQVALDREGQRFVKSLAAPRDDLERKLAELDKEER